MKLILRPLALILYVKQPIFGKFTGYCFGPLILIQERVRGVEGWEVHELTHTKQFYRTFGLHALLYYMSKKYRLEAEKEAYTAQLNSENPGITHHYADVMLQRLS